MKIRILFFIFFIIFSSIYSADYDVAITNAQKELNSIRNKNQKLLIDIENQRENILNKIRISKNKIRDLRKNYSNLLSKISKFEQIKMEFEKNLAERNYETNDFKNCVKERVRDFYTNLKLSFVSAQYRDKTVKLKNLMNNNQYPDKNYLLNSFNILLHEIIKGNKIEKFSGNYYKSDGLENKADIIRFGKLFSLFKNPQNKFGFLNFRSINGYLTEIPLKLSRKFNDQIKSYFNLTIKKKYMIIPADITEGVALRHNQVRKDFIEHIKNGGIIVYPIIFLGIFALIIVIERFFTLNQLHTKSDKLMPELIETIKIGKWQTAENICMKLPGAASRVCLAGLKHKNMDKLVIEDIMQESILKELPALERFLPTLRILAAIAPLLGLLGTVTGMIGTFDVISIFGTGDPRLMSGGISEALVTTELGLMTAVPILLMHSFLLGRVNHIVNDMEKNAVTLVNLFVLKSKI